MRIKIINEAGSELILPRTLFLDRTPFQKNIPVENLYGRDGQVKIGPTTMRERTFAIHGAVYHRDKNEIKQVYDEILAFCAGGGLLKVFRNYMDERFLIAELASVNPKWLDQDVDLRLDMQFLSTSPFWQAEEVAENINDARIIFSPGTALSRPVIRTLSAVQSLEIENVTTGQRIEILEADGKIEIDCHNFILLQNGEKRIDLVDPDWFLKGFDIAPGANEILTSRPISISYPPQWY